MNIYIVHYKKMIDRKEYLGKIFPDAIWVDIYQRETLNIDEHKIYDSSPELWFDRIREVYKNLPEYRQLKLSEICNSLSHIKVLELIIEKNKPYALILEDDVVPEPDFFVEIEKIQNNLPDDFDLIFLGSSYSMSVIENCTLNTQPIQIKSGQRIYKKIPPLTRTVDSYLISLPAAKKLYSTINKIVLPYDWDLNYFLKKLDMDVYWYEPGILNQGSRTGKYKSSIR